MVQEPKRTIAYLCPECRQAVVVEKTVFSLAAGPGRIPCPCSRSALKTELLGDRVKLTVPCLFCGREHTVACSTHAFLHERALAFSCAASGLDCCYVGEEGAVFAAMRRLEEADLPLLRTFLGDPKVMYAWEHGFTDEEIRKWIAQNQRRYHQG